MAQTWTSNSYQDQYETNSWVETNSINERTGSKMGIECTRKALCDKTKTETLRHPCLLSRYSWAIPTWWKDLQFRSLELCCFQATSSQKAISLYCTDMFNMIQSDLHKLQPWPQGLPQPPAMAQPWHGLLQCVAREEVHDHPQLAAAVHLRPHQAATRQHVHGAHLGTRRQARDAWGGGGDRDALDGTVGENGRWWMKLMIYESGKNMVKM